MDYNSHLQNIYSAALGLYSKPYREAHQQEKAT